VDGYLWSKPGQLAGLRLKTLLNGQEIILKGEIRYLKTWIRKP
jgi:hypothetical protein